MGIEEQRYDDLVGLIYESAHDQSLLVPVMREICKTIGAAAGHFVKMDISTGIVSASAITDPAYSQGDAEYGTYYGQIDPRLDWLGSGNVGEWRADHERFDKSFVERNEFYSDFLRKYDVRHIVGGYIGEQATQKETMGFLRPLGASIYTEKEFHFLQRLSPHLIRSATLRARLEQLNRQHEQDQMEISQLPYGTVWVKSDLKIMSMNHTARLLLALNDGVGVAQGRLLAYDANERLSLEHLLRTAVTPARGIGSWMAIRRRQNKLPLLISIIPSPVRTIPSTFDAASALILLRDPSYQPIPQVQQLQYLFKFTPAEAKLAEALLLNETLQSYSEKNQISRNTSRTHLVSLFAKTGARRQAELIRILLSVRPL